MWLWTENGISLLGDVRAPPFKPSLPVHRLTEELENGAGELVKMLGFTEALPLHKSQGSPRNQQMSAAALAFASVKITPGFYLDADHC